MAAKLPELLLSTSPVVVQEPAGSSLTDPEEKHLEEEFIVEQILEKKTLDGHIFYLIKWQGFADKDNTWEPEEHLSDCPELLEEFHRSSRINGDLQEGDPITAVEPEISLPINTAIGARAIHEADGTPMEKIGFARGLDAQKIIGMTEFDGELGFIMTWHGSSVVDIVRARDANIKCPQVVISFYEQRINWSQGRTLEEMLKPEEESESEESENGDEEDEEPESAAYDVDTDANRGIIDSD